MSTSKQRILITGGAGFVGLHLARLHRAHNDDVTLVDNFFRGTFDEDLHSLLSAGVELLECDLTDPVAWTRLGTGYDYVYHLAAANGTRLFYDIPHEVLRINTLSSIHAMEWFKTNKAGSKVMFTSSSETYAGALEAFSRLPIPTPEDVPLVIPDVKNPRWTYAATKIIGEQLLAHYAARFGFRMVIVRPHNFYGPRAGNGHVIPQLIERIGHRTDPFPIYGADEARSFCYIHDAVDGMRRIMMSTATDGETYNIGTSEVTPIRDLAEMLFEISGWRPDQVQAFPAPRGSVRLRQPSVQKVLEAVGWRATTSLRAGLRSTYDWHTDRLLTT